MAAMHLFTMAIRKKQDTKYKQFGGQLTRILQQYRLPENEDTGPFHGYQVEASLIVKNFAIHDKHCEKKAMRANQSYTTKPIIIVAPTGAGKSGIIVLLPYVLESAKVLVLTPSKVISEQLRREFEPSRGNQCFFEKTGFCTEPEMLENLLEPVHVVRSTEEVLNPGFGLRNLVIVNAQKFGGRSKTSLVYRNEEIVPNVEAFFARFDTLIVDEAHHYPAKTWDKIVTEFSKPVRGLFKKIIFLTATPYRKNASGEGVTYIWEHIDGGRERIAMEIKPRDVEGRTTRPCEFKESKDKMTSERVANHVSWFLMVHGDKEPRMKPQAMILVRTIREAVQLAKEMNDYRSDENFAVAILGRDSGKPNKEKTPLKKFTAGNYRVAITCGVALEGYDNKNVTLCVILRKIVNGRITFSQFIGRCQRMHLDLEGDVPDRNVGTVFSYAEFQQRKMWDDMACISDNDPVEVDDDDNE